MMVLKLNLTFNKLNLLIVITFLTLVCPLEISPGTETGIEETTISFTKEQIVSTTEEGTNFDPHYEHCNVSLSDGVNLPWMASLGIWNKTTDSNTHQDWYPVVIIDPYILLASGTIFRSPRSNGKLMLEMKQNYHIRMTKKPGDPDKKVKVSYMKAYTKTGEPLNHWTKSEYDIVLIHLEEPITFNVSIRPLCLPNWKVEPKSDSNTEEEEFNFNDFTIPETSFITLTGWRCKYHYALQDRTTAFDFALKGYDDCKYVWNLQTKLSSDVSLEYKDRICGTPTIWSWKDLERDGNWSKDMTGDDETDGKAIFNKEFVFLYPYAKWRVLKEFKFCNPNMAVYFADPGLCHNKPYYVIQTINNTQRILIGLFNGIAQDMSLGLTAYVLMFNPETVGWINNHKSCEPGNYTCDDGQCVPLMSDSMYNRSIICDHHKDCEDGSDENLYYCCSRVYLDDWVNHPECNENSSSDGGWVKNMWYMILGISLGFFVIGITSGVSFVRKWGARMRKRQFYLTKAEVLAFRQGIPGDNFAAGILKSEKSVGPSLFNRKTKDDDIQLTSMEMPYIYDIEKDKIKFGTIIGSGEFGTVYKGTVSSKPVAIKALKTEIVDKEMFKTFLIELKILAYINYIKGGHPNVINLVGAYTNNIKNLELYIVVEYCHFGSIADYLKENRHKFISKATSGFEKDKQYLSRHDFSMDWYLKELPAKTYIQADLLQTFSQKDLISWCIQIADGLHFLSSHKIIHGDLAARNILLDFNLTAKMSDFGLSRQIYYYNCPAAKVDKKLKLPWRWLAPEVIDNFKISIQSDVWSFGITMWEIYTLGAIPYGGLEWSPNFIEQLKCGLRLTKPEYATDEIFNIIQDTWKYSANDRPDFDSIKANLGKISSSIL